MFFNNRMGEIPIAKTVIANTTLRARTTTIFSLCNWSAIGSKRIKDNITVESIGIETNESYPDELDYKILSDYSFRVLEILIAHQKRYGKIPITELYTNR